MYPLRIWRNWNPNSISPSAPLARRRPRALPFALLALLAALLYAPAALAETPIEVLSDQQSYVFGESLDFGMEARSASPIVDVILFYGREGERIVRRIYPPFQPGTAIEVSYSEALEGGQFAPGTRLTTWWEMHAGDGSTLTTQPASFEYIDANQDWQLLSGQRADVYWYGKGQAKARTLLARAETAIAILEGEIGVAIERKVNIYVYNSAQDMKPALASRGDTYDLAVVTLGVAAEDDTMILLGTHPDAEVTVAHEMSHVVVGIATDNAFAGLPRWLDEGLAMYAEGELPTDNQLALESAIRQDNLLSIRSMSSYSGQASQVDLFYGEVYSVVDFMLGEYGRDQMRELLAVFAQGTRQEDALQRIYGFGLDELNAQWRASLGLQPRAQAVAGATPTIVTARPPQGRSSSPCASPLAALSLPLLVGACLGATRLRTTR